MKNDIFNLKIGKAIYQVDYDHKTGLFTSPECIESQDNIIVCGLHCIYNTNQIYNLKIFMDTEKNLKNYWKIKRDTKERGYTLNKVLENIKKRTDDFNKFILPQKELSDIIIKFYTNDIINFNNLEEKLNISLCISIKNENNLIKIIKKFQEYRIEYKIESNKNYNSIIFINYINSINLIKDLENNNIIISNNFYDYILLIIYNMYSK
jgi:uridine kinase